MFFGIVFGCIIDLAILLKKEFSKKNVLIFLMPVISFIVAIMELKQDTSAEAFICVDLNYIFTRLEKYDLFADIIHSVIGKYSCFDIEIGTAIFAVILLFVVVYLYVFFCNADLRKKDYGINIVYMCGNIIYWGIIIFVRGADHIQLAIIPLCFFLLFCWGICDKNSYGQTCYGEIALVSVCVLSLPISLISGAKNDYEGDYSGSREIAAIANDIIPEGAIIAIQNDELSTSVYAYLDELGKDYFIWDINNECEYSIHKWGKANKRNMTWNDISSILRNDFPGRTDVYFIGGQYSLENFTMQYWGMRQIGRNHKTNTWNEYYGIYKIL